MENIMEFPPPKKDEPDSDCVRVIAEDGKPVKWFKYGVSYSDGEKMFSFHIWARDRDDAEKRVASIRATASLDGQIFAEVPW